MLKRFKNKPRENDSQKVDSRMVGTLILLIVVTMVLFAVYRFLIDFYYFEVVLIIYMIVATGFVLSYVIYNRGFSRKGITAEMLPDSWTEEQKTEFIESGARRLARSRWMLIPIFAFLFTFSVDLIELLVIPFFKTMFFS